MGWCQHYRQTGTCFTVCRWLYLWPISRNQGRRKVTRKCMLSRWMGCGGRLKLQELVAQQMEWLGLTILGGLGGGIGEWDREDPQRDFGWCQRGRRLGSRVAVELDLGVAQSLGMRRYRKLVTRISKVTQRLKVPKGNTSCVAIYTMWRAETTLLQHEVSSSNCIIGIQYLTRVIPTEYI